MDRLPLPSVIFAGGKSSRMGVDKSLLPFGGYPTLTQYQYHRLTPHFTRVLISTKEDKFNFPAPLILDRYPQSSPLVGLISILESIDEEGCFILSVDAPFVDISIMRSLYEASLTAPYDAIIAQSLEGSEPLCGIYNRTILGKAKEFLEGENHRLGALLGAVNTLFVPFNSSEPFENLNHPHEYERALGRV